MQILSKRQGCGILIHALPHTAEVVHLESLSRSDSNLVKTQLKINAFYCQKMVFI